LWREHIHLLIYMRKNWWVWIWAKKVVKKSLLQLQFRILY